MILITFNVIFILYTTDEEHQSLIVKPAAYVTGSEGKNITLICEAVVGVFNDMPSWFFRGHVIDKNEAKPMFVTELVKEKRISELHIQNAQPGDSGEYVCKAETIHGNSTQRSIQLTVRGKYSKLRSLASVVSIMMVKFKIDRKH